ncbi:PREDICTED: SH2 domain-containing protein 1B [Chinchilla lanigera]|uniref:SH2 domain containing 1B n=1 Tax=Chinchilla lanigera TaxID=34839 RepID=A0A8C2V0W7_CHILA|nr:PREDICTED: SH2 domain-containing protein 1B [Chinchilla lanigera]
MDLPYYHGALTKQECEILLLKEGVNGNFLIRDSESIPGVLCLCVSFNNCVYTYRIFREKYGYFKIQNADSARKLIFPTLEELVSKFEKPGQGLVVHLSKPIKRRSQLATDNVYENSDDYVDVLP